LEFVILNTKHPVKAVEQLTPGISKKNKYKTAKGVLLMDKPEHHIFVCASFRAGGDAKGVCHKKGSINLLPYIENEILDRGLNAQITSTGCMKACDHGPVMVIHSQNLWYGQVDSEEVVDEILDALEDGGIAEDRLIP
jgi:(2Fe-2S) ferredoxin